MLPERMIAMLSAAATSPAVMLGEYSALKRPVCLWAPAEEPSSAQTMSGVQMSRPLVWFIPGSHRDNGAGALRDCGAPVPLSR